MLTVVFACDESGKSNTRKPLARPYSVMPSTVGPCVTPGGSAACATQQQAKRNRTAHARCIRDIGVLMGWTRGRGADYTGSLAASLGLAMDLAHERKFLPRRVGGHSSPAGGDRNRI